MTSLPDGRSGADSRPRESRRHGSGAGQGSVGSAPGVPLTTPGAASTRLRGVTTSAVSLERFDLDDLDLDALGACTAEPFRHVRQSIDDRVASGAHAGLRFTFADPATATDVTATHPWARSLVVAGRSYVPETARPLGAPGQGRVARFATANHYEPLRRALEFMAADLRTQGHRAEVLCDDNRLVDRAAAVRAGLGWWGKSTMVIAPRVGPWMLFGSVVTDATVAASPAMVRDCGTCAACIPACPTGALDTPGELDARRCLAAILQKPGSIPDELREAVGDRLYGCDECLISCPPGQRLEQESRDGSGVDLAEILAVSDDDLLARFAHFYIPRRDARYLRRNALVALGNSGTSDHVPVLVEYLHHRSGLLRQHAAWALGQIGGVAAREALETRLDIETVADVRHEIRSALAR